MERTFEIRTEPHKAVIGDDTLLFEPETPGGTFAAAYGALKEAQAAVTAAGDNIGAAELSLVSQGMRDFIDRFLLDESKALFATMKLPDRVLTQILEFVAELYGGGSGNDRGGPSSES